METLVRKPSNNDRNPTGNASPNVQYASISNTNPSTAAAAAPTTTTAVQVAATPQVIVSQPAPISKPAKPVRDSAQFVSF